MHSRRSARSCPRLPRRVSCAILPAVPAAVLQGPSLCRACRHGRAPRPGLETGGQARPTIPISCTSAPGVSSCPWNSSIFGTTAFAPLVESFQLSFFAVQLTGASLSTRRTVPRLARAELVFCIAVDPDGAWQPTRPVHLHTARQRGAGVGQFQLDTWILVQRNWAGQQHQYTGFPILVKKAHRGASAALTVDGAKWTRAGRYGQVADHRTSSRVGWKASYQPNIPSPASNLFGST